MNMKSNKKSKSIINILMNTLMYIFLSLCLVMLLLCIFIKKDSDGAVSILGYQTRIVVSESMEKCSSTYDVISKYKIKSIPLKSLVFIKKVPKNEASKHIFYKNIKVGDVLTFRYVIGNKQHTITHRVININNSQDDKYIELRGDNITTNDFTNTTSQIIYPDEELSPNYIIGKVIGKSYILGVLLYSIKQPIGMLLIIIIPSIIIMIVEIIKIINYIYSVKKRKTDNELLLQKEELEQLKQKLQKLEKSEEGGKYV